MPIAILALAWNIHIFSIICGSPPPFTIDLWQVGFWIKVYWLSHIDKCQQFPEISYSSLIDWIIEFGFSLNGKFVCGLWPLFKCINILYLLYRQRQSSHIHPSIRCNSLSIEVRLRVFECAKHGSVCAGINQIKRSK